jgi:hypothetical protein
MPPEIDEAMARGWTGVLRLYDPRLRLNLRRSITAGDASYEWEFRLVDPWAVQRDRHEQPIGATLPEKVVAA